jgi:hypothetical protein
MYGEGDRPVTMSGRVTTPFPKVDTTTGRRTLNTLRRVDAWLLTNAKAEIAAQGWIDTLPADPRRMTQADRDMANVALFDA